MNKREIVTIGISGLAFLISLVTLIQKRYENRSARRIQLTETMNTLLTILTEIDTLNYQSDQALPEERRPIKRLIGKRRIQLYSVALQADFLIQKLPGKVISEVEYSS